MLWSQHTEQGGTTQRKRSSDDSRVQNGLRLEDVKTSCSGGQPGPLQDIYKTLLFGLSIICHRISLLLIILDL